MDIRYTTLLNKLQNAKKIIDLGCGNNPVRGTTVAVDCHVEPHERSLGHGATINIKAMENQGITFVNQRIDRPLPFADKEFDFAYSSHAFEHLEDPATACREMMRIAKAGAIITPSIFAEIAFGRHYHHWLTIDRNNTIFFFRKHPDEDCPFGEHPESDGLGGWKITETTNPFDIFLDDGEWHGGKEGSNFLKMQNKLRDHWYNHTMVTENIFLWEGSFCHIIIN